MRILLVEDHVAVAQISRDLLSEVYEHEVEHVSTGAGALAAMTTFQPEMVLLDLNLPDMGGYDIAALVRANPLWESVILVALTGFGSDLDPSRAAAVGIDAHFRKPMNFDLLPEIKRAG